MSADGQYANGPVVVGASYTSVSNVIPDASGVPNGKSQLWQLFGSYNFGVAKVSGLYERETNDYAVPTAKHYMLGLTVPVGPGSILASYNYLDNGAADGTAKQYAIGYTYSLSKQTDLYASYAHISNGANTAFAVGSSTDSFSGVAGQSSSGMAIGIRHMF